MHPAHNDFTISQWDCPAHVISSPLPPPLSLSLSPLLFCLSCTHQEAIKHVQPSAKREGFATVPNTTWADVGALQAVREELSMAILAPVRYPDQFDSLGLSSPPGVLLAGPPGCGKTLLAKVCHPEQCVCVCVCVCVCESMCAARMCLF